MRRWTWMICGLLLCGMSVDAQNNPAISTARMALKNETSYRPETNFLSTPLLPAAPLTIETTPVDQTIDGVRVRGYRAVPAGKKPLGAILLLPEWWGLNQSIRGEAESWAREGFIVLAADLYEGEVARNRGEAARFMARIKPEIVLIRLKAALTLLAGSQSGTAAGSFKIGVVGFGIGATYAQRLAAADTRPAALAVFYGEPLKDKEQLQKIKAPVLGVFAALDGWITPAKVENFKKALTGSKLPPLIFSYQTKPGFMFNAGDPADKVYAETARQKTLIFLKRELGQ